MKIGKMLLEERRTYERMLFWLGSRNENGGDVGLNAFLHLEIILITSHVILAPPTLPPERRLGRC